MSEVRLITPITRQGAQKMQVAAYCRVSSNSADQLNSYAAQIRAYKKIIGARDDWELVDIFADEGLTGMKSETRSEFQRMIRMCELKQINLIVTKSISRFARNTKDALAYVRKLKLLGVGVMFEKEGISTLSMGDEMLLNTFAALAQEESQSISMNQRLSIVKRMELGEYIDSNAPYGYRLVNKMLEVDESEAAIVRNIFSLYLQGFSTGEIARELNIHNIPTKTGKDIWRSGRVSYILKNERYIGDSFYQKTYRETTVPFNQHINRGQEDRFYAKDTHPAIVEKDVFDAVQKLIEKRKGNFAKTTSQNIYPLTSRIQCSECGSFYRRRLISGTVKWVCSLHKDDSTACDSNYYSEERIYDGFITMVNKLRFSEDNILAQVISRLEMTLVAMKRNNLAARDMDYVRKQPLFNSQYRRWKFIAVCSAVDDDVKARYDSQKSKGKKGLVAEIDNYEVYALTWDDVFQSFDLRHAFLLDKLKMDEEAIAAEIAQTAGDEKSKDTADALTALVAN